jgi:hypothetical protein
MEPIPEGIVEKTWQEVAGFSPDIFFPVKEEDLEEQATVNVLG